MTDQYQQTNINQQRPARFVDQSNFDAVIAGVDVVSLGNDATFILLGNEGGPPTPYTVLLPDVQNVQGFFFFFRNASGAEITIRAQAGQEVDGSAEILVTATEVVIMVSDPVNNNTVPPTLPINWSVLKTSSAVES